MIDDMMPGRLRVLIVDECDATRRELCSVLHLEPGVLVVGEAPTIAGALAMASQVNPQLIVCELTVAGKSVTELLAGLAQVKSTARVLILTDQAGAGQMRLAMSAGACAYLLKHDGRAELIEALRVVGVGRRFFSDSVETTILTQYAESIAARFGVATTLITPREREVLARIGHGQSNKAIARSLLLSVKTVEKHRSNLMRKLGLHNTASVTAYAMRQGLVSEEAVGLST